MEIPEKLLRFKYHISFAVAFSLLICCLIYVAPRFLDILAYFWPLLVSTALFLVTVVVFGRISPPVAEASGEKAGEGILDFVTGAPDPVPEPTSGGEEDGEEEEEEGEEEDQKSGKKM